MSLCLPLRQTNARPCFRYISAAQPNRPKSTMTPAKLRALVSLYHQADTFITSENLSKRIDDAFILPFKYTGISTLVQGTEFKTVKYLKDELGRQRMEPKLTDPINDKKGAAPNNTASWSGRMGNRDEKVMEALYGVQRGRDGQVLPGLGALLEERGRLEKETEVDEQLWKA